MKTCQFLTLMLLLAATACAPSAPPPGPTVGAAATLPAVVPGSTPEPTPTPGPAPTVVTCPPGEQPVFVLGFADLKERLGDRMGEPLSCERPGPGGDALQQTTTGMARYRQTANMPSFTNGNEHWALTDRGLVHWTGRALDPPDNAEAIDESELTSQVTPTAAPPPAARASPTPYGPAITLPPDTGADVVPGLPGWIQKPVVLLREYDRRNATALVPAIVRADIAVGHLGGANGAWGVFVPSSHRIMLDASLADESPQAVAAVLGHEADHARDTFQYGPPRTEAACYSFEITAFALEARIWTSFYGPSGKSDPNTPLEDELNLILRTSRTNAGGLIGAIKSNYQAECE